MASTKDADLARDVRNTDFEQHSDGSSILPPATSALGKRLHASIVNSDGSVNTALEAEAQGALREKGFVLASAPKGNSGRVGLHTDTHRARNPGSQTDAELAAEVRNTDFEQHSDGKPILPLKTTPLGQRLYTSIVDKNGVVNTGLEAEAQGALREKGFVLVSAPKGRPGRVGLHTETHRTNPTNEYITDADLARDVRNMDFEQHSDGSSILPSSATALGKRLHASIVNSDGTVGSALKAEAQGALHEKGFVLASATKGRPGRVGLHTDTHRAGKPGSQTDAELAAEVRNTDFEQHSDGKPILPPKTTPLGQRLYSSIVKSDGTVGSALKAEAQGALHEKGFVLASAAKGRVGLHSDTLRASSAPRRVGRGRRPDRVAASSAPAPVAGVAQALNPPARYPVPAPGYAAPAYDPVAGVAQALNPPAYPPPLHGSAFNGPHASPPSREAAADALVALYTQNAVGRFEGRGQIPPPPPQSAAYSSHTGVPAARVAPPPSIAGVAAHWQPPAQAADGRPDVPATTSGQNPNPPTAGHDRSSGDSRMQLARILNGPSSAPKRPRRGGRT